MTTQLLTTWYDHDQAFREILVRAQRSICVFDLDLAWLPFESKAHAETLYHFLKIGNGRRFSMALRNAEPFRSRSPRLMKLLADYPQRMSVLECPPHLASLTDSLMLIDDSHALIRFHQDHARSKRIDDDSKECQPYHQRFAEILQEGGNPVSASVLGL